MLDWNTIDNNIRNTDASWWDKLTDWLGFTTKQTDAIRANAAKYAAQIMDEANTQTDDIETLYNKGRGAAGVAANDKAGIAKKQATAAAKMGNASKLQAAIAGANAANDAVQQGYDETANQAAAMEASRQSQQAQMNYNRAAQQAGTISDMYGSLADSKDQTAQQRLNRAAQVGASMASSFFGA